MTSSVVIERRVRGVHGSDFDERSATRARELTPLVCVAILHATLLAFLAFSGASALVGIPLVALTLVYGSNTYAHLLIHRPIANSPLGHCLESLTLTAILGFPQSLWAARHRAHHRARPHRVEATGLLIAELTSLIGLAITLVACAPGYLGTVHFPGVLLGLALASVQGHYEHHRGVVSHYGRVYNLLTFNDGHHAEHHEAPGIPWTRSGLRRSPRATVSRWPPLWRWLEDHPIERLLAATLAGLERSTTRWAWVRRLLLSTHGAALDRILRGDEPCSIVIVGGGLFPRSALLLAARFPSARITVVERNPRHLELARHWMPSHVETKIGTFPADGLEPRPDLLVLPLGLVGPRTVPARADWARTILVHDWIWRQRGRGTIVSALLLKRLLRTDP